MEKTKKMLRNLVLFILLIVLTFSIVFKEQNIDEIFSVLNTVKKEYVALAIICMCLYIVLDAVNIGRVLKNLKEKNNFIKNVKYSLIGFFFSAITPAASGGQPMQVYYMKKDQISVAHSTLALLVNLCCIQIVTISLGLFSMIFNYQYLSTPLILLFVLGILLNLSALTLLLISILSRRATKWLIKKVVKIMKFFKVKNVEEKQKKIECELKTYQVGARYIRANRLLVIKNLLVTYVQYIFYYGISYCVYKSFGLSEHNIFEIITMQSVLYGTVSGIPSPGAVGVSEGGYMAIFGKVYSEGMLGSAMLLTRGINFYLFVIISAVVVIINTIRDKKELNNVEEELKKVDL